MIALQKPILSLAGFDDKMQPRKFNLINLKGLSNEKIHTAFLCVNAVLGKCGGK